MPSELWFKNKKYGWGWTPANAKGWIVVLAYTLVMGVYPIYTAVEKREFSLEVFYSLVIVLTIALIFICIKKGEKPQWRWGDKK